MRRAGTVGVQLERIEELVSFGKRGDELERDEELGREVELERDEELGELGATKSLVAEWSSLNVTFGTKSWDRSRARMWRCTRRAGT